MLKSSLLRYTIILSASVQLTACITTPALPDHERPQQWGTLVNQQHNFYHISDTVFRSEQPNAEIIPELKKHDIDVVINLRSRDKDKTVLSQQNFQLVHVPIHTWALDRNDLLSVMKTIQTAKSKNQKVLIHCYHGSDRTGASVAMYRIIFENWSTQDALNEMKHGGYGFHPIWINIEKQFSTENIQWIRQQLAI
ncbi:dual specificity protein phosphatase family protein [Acinetobacter wuhouensis]|uniref:Protein tyrosine phosphatase n=1 Tax=Acinetobacter wuhouensis TaxID=1879050 RepID=A0A4Q7ACL5_9GAMM|nr:dual specificity protein phosphatase family protein [Acinetobacter wuhouensis]RZG43827.1 protein tyrosine phosphatase [Acinetobacter wuhouensis]RZG71074.1 protein tyrosine phosphatase [Acinetobacter wuhouensis]